MLISISLSCGLVKALYIKGAKENLIAVIEGSSLRVRQAFKDVNNDGANSKNIIFLVNDNIMPFAKNYGGFYQNLAKLHQKIEQQINLSSIWFGRIKTSLIFWLYRF